MLALLRRDLALAYRRWGDIASPVMFFAIVSALFPLALSPRREVLQELGPGVLWIAALLAMLLSLNALFRQDLEDGSMEQLAIGPHSLPALMLAKAAAHWLVAGLPLIALAPLTGGHLPFARGGRHRTLRDAGAGHADA